MKPKLSNVTVHWKNRALIDIIEEFNGSVYVERWVDISGYEGHYQISDFGRVKSLERLTPHYRGGFLKKKTIILSQNTDTDGYPQVLLCKNGISESCKIHQCVANHYIPNIGNKPTVNHKWGIKTDNRYHQLEWFAEQEQIIHSYEVLKRKNSPSCWGSGINNPKSKRVKQLDLSGNEVAIFSGAREAQRITGISRCTISQVCNKNNYYKTAGGYKWEYV